MRVACDACKGRGWKWNQNDRVSCTHTGGSDICDSCADFLARVLPVVAIHNRKPQQEDVATMLGYTARHLRRLCGFLGYHSWPSFFAAARDGLLHQQHDEQGNAVLVPFRRPA